MDVTDIDSIELDKSRPFRWEVLLKDSTGHVLERIPVKEEEADAIFKVATQNWLEACFQLGQPKTGINAEELRERRKHE